MQMIMADWACKRKKGSGDGLCIFFYKKVKDVDGVEYGGCI